MLFRHRETPIFVTLYPMVHIGERAFYEEVYREAFAHDVTLIEGVRSPIVRHLTRSYRWLSLKKLGLVLQPKSPPQESVHGRIIKADLSAEEFRREWRKVSLPLRGAFFLLSPLIGLGRRFFASRESLARGMSLEDRKSSNEILGWRPSLEPVNHSILHARDQRLTQCLAAELHGGAEKRIAVVYGAMHIRAVLECLRSRGFYCSEASWRTVFSA
jgi:hypothetical protein